MESNTKNDADSRALVAVAALQFMRYAYDVLRWHRVDYRDTALGKQEQVHITIASAQGMERGAPIIIHYYEMLQRAVEAEKRRRAFRVVGTPEPEPNKED